ncbi:MAG: hypothetical protein UX00_C0018G0001 [Microgenomates group bacterium GW2011_GWB1_45_17]|nr:MAG: hypothetical protein UX00_C0018G0001 [Microgenomates group bacterium GW2011_GWB1_45_17]
MPEGEPIGVEPVLVRDPGSPSGPRENVPAWQDRKGRVFILGEDGKLHQVLPVGLGQVIISQVLEAMWERMDFTT